MNKIIFLLPSIKISGGNRVIIEIANKLINKNIQVDLVYPNNSDKTSQTFFIDPRINIKSVGNFKNNKLKKLLNLLEMFFYINHEYENENVIITDPIMSIFSPIIKNNRLFRYIQADDYIIFDDLYLLKSKFLLKIYKNLTKISYNYQNITFLFNSKYTYDRFIQVSNRKDVPLKLVHPAINHKIFFNQKIRNPNEFNICIIARKHPLKGFKDFVEVYHNIKNKINIDNVYVLSPDDLTEFNLDNMIVIKPKNDEEIAYYMNKSHVFISTSWWEGFGLPPLEAMACGCAVVLTNAGGVNEYAKPNLNCLMFEPKNTKELEKLILYLYNNRDVIERLSKEGEKTAKLFSWEKSAEQLLKVLEL